ncbi:hypothetical protein OR60_08685 [Xanthomonas vesicatoria]|uniref:Uncharacterized protein n=3 Tax=Xanthomonas TaxID=338 RepID=A0AAJ0IXE8_9XANT|nr:hypothetical protein BI313_21575 [Xanthomonas vesicatoria]KHM93299.1 hypothetical protein OR61_14480 [Xanthomonas vesicatoria]KHM95321.1 hypothetical protein OR60_08685 [Xanthomonas vesicatoria]
MAARAQTLHNGPTPYQRSSTMRRTKPLSESSMQTAESHIPALAAQAGREAHARALRQGGRVVMKSAAGWLIERHVSGQDVEIKRLPKSTPVSAGAVLRRGGKPASKPAAER